MFITVQDVANILNVKKSTIYSWVNAGLIPHYRLCGGPLRFKREEIVAWVEQFKKTTAEKPGAGRYPVKGKNNIDHIIRRAINEEKSKKI